MYDDDVPGGRLLLPCPAAALVLLGSCCEALEVTIDMAIGVDIILLCCVGPSGWIEG